MVEKTEQEVIAEQAALADQIQANNRQIAGFAQARVEAFAQVVSERITATDIAAIQAAATGLTDFGALHAKNLIELLTASPSLLALEIERLQRIAAPPSPTPAPTPNA
jgi:hypothetical protein